MQSDDKSLNKAENNADKINNTNSFAENDKVKKFQFDYQRVILPIVYLIILCIIFVPVVIFGLKGTTSYVKKVQNELTADYYDVQVDSAFYPSNVTFGVINTPVANRFSCVGQIKFNDDSDGGFVYYGANRVCLREGGAISTKYDLPGQGGTTIMFGYNSSYIGFARSLKVGDTFNLTTGYGVFDYKVKETLVTDNSNLVNTASTDREKLIIVLDGADEFFSSYNGNKVYIISEKISGPASEVKMDE